jgi:hypothetical protein
MLNSVATMLFLVHNCFHRIILCKKSGKYKLRFPLTFTLPERCMLVMRAVKASSH